MNKKLKNSLKRLLSVAMVLILLFTLFVGCGGSDANEKDEIPSLSSEKENEFKELFYNKYKDNYPTTTLDDIKVHFLGEFNGAYAIIIETRVEIYMPDVYEVVNGLEFVYSDAQPMNIVHDGELYRLEEAYNMGLITDDDLSLLCKRCRPICNVTLDSDFEVTTVFVKVMPSYNFKEYTPKDFSEVNCIEVEELFPDKEYKEGELERWLVLTIRSFSKTTTLKAIKKLEQRSDVYYVEPNYIFKAC